MGFIDFKSRDALALEAFEFAVARVRNLFLQAIEGNGEAKALRAVPCRAECAARRGLLRRLSGHEPRCGK